MNIGTALIIISVAATSLLFTVGFAIVNVVGGDVRLEGAEKKITLCEKGLPRQQKCILVAIPEDVKSKHTGEDYE